MLIIIKPIIKSAVYSSNSSVDGEKNAKNNVNNKLINICFNSKLGIRMTSKNAQIFSERFFGVIFTNLFELKQHLIE